jgi:uncharacterized protein YukE
MDDFKTRAAALAGSAAPSGASQGAWEQAGADLERAVAELGTACGEGAAPEQFDAAFARVHDAFHAAMKVASGGGQHEGHGEHHQGPKK